MNATSIECNPSQAVQLGHYEAGDVERVLLGQRIDGVVCVFDHPRRGDGRSYFVESGFESKAELAVLVSEYRRRAMRLGTCPMSREAIDRVIEGALL